MIKGFPTSVDNHVASMAISVARRNQKDYQTLCKKQQMQTGGHGGRQESTPRLGEGSHPTSDANAGHRGKGDVAVDDGNGGGAQVEALD